MNYSEPSLAFLYQHSFASHLFVFPAVLIVLCLFVPGRVLLLENSRSTNPFLGLYQDATADAVASMGGKGCVYNQDVEHFVRGSGMVVLKQQGYAAGFFRSFVCAAPQ